MREKTLWSVAESRRLRRLSYGREGLQAGAVINETFLVRTSGGLRTWGPRSTIRRHRVLLGREDRETLGSLSEEERQGENVRELVQHDLGGGSLIDLVSGGFLSLASAFIPPAQKRKN